MTAQEIVKGAISLYGIERPMAEQFFIVVARWAFDQVGKCDTCSNRDERHRSDCADTNCWTPHPSLLK